MRLCPSSFLQFVSVAGKKDMQVHTEHFQTLAGRDIVKIGAHASAVDQGDRPLSNDLDPLTTLDDERRVLIHANAQHLWPLRQNGQQPSEAPAFRKMRVNDALETKPRPRSRVAAYLSGRGGVSPSASIWLPPACPSRAEQEQPETAGQEPVRCQVGYPKATAATAVMTAMHTKFSTRPQRIIVP